MGKTIQIVDDSATITMSLKAALEMAGFKVLTASDGQQALAAIKGGHRPDLIITDINMPRMGGLDLIREVKSMPAHRFTPILTLTTESEAAKRDEGRRLGAAGWLVKPVRGPDLLQVIRKVLPGT